MRGSLSTAAVVGKTHRTVKQFRLTVIRGEDKGRTHDSDGDRVAIGSHPSNDFRLTDRTLSRFHCEIVIRDGKALLRDVGSRNGTEVDGTEVQGAYLKTKQVLTLGKTEIRFELRETETVVPLSTHERFGLLVGGSDVMRAVFASLERAAQTDSTVLLLGETGTGKDLAAESIHTASERRNGPFVVVDCASLPPSLVEAELFGYEKGAFTGADRSQRGAFEAAHGGTLFLDEIGELPLELQPKFLRALENRTVQRLGSGKTSNIDVRVVAATNRALRREVNAKRFRADLFYRLAILEITLPALRERREDVRLLVETMLEGMGKDVAESIAVLEAQQFFQTWVEYAWPGNVRELRNHLERSLAFPEENAAPAARSIAGIAIDTTQPFQVVRDQWLRNLERTYLETILERHGGNASEAMRAAGIPRVQFYRMVRRCGLKRSER